MELDLTRLNSLAFMDFTGKKEAPKKPSETLKGDGVYKTPIEVKKPLETLTEGLEGINKLQREADRKKQDIDRSLAICREYQQNIKTSSQLQTEILKGARAGEDIYSLFLKAVKAISLMTSNTVFYSQLEGDIRAIYGQGLLDPLPLQIELHQIRNDKQYQYTTATTFESNGWKEFAQVLNGWSGSAEAYWGDKKFFDMLGEIVVVKLFVDAGASQRCVEGFAIINGDGIESATDQLVQESIDYTGVGPLYIRL